MDSRAKKHGKQHGSSISKARLRYFPIRARYGVATKKKRRVRAWGRTDTSQTGNVLGAGRFQGNGVQKPKRDSC